MSERSSEGIGISNVQCPHCGTFHVDGDWFWYHPGANRQVRRTPWRSIGYGLITYAVLVGVAACGLIGEDFFAGLIVLITVLTFVQVAAIELVRARDIRHSVRMWQYQCRACGYKWHQREGQPVPPAYQPRQQQAPPPVA